MKKRVLIALMVTTGLILSMLLVTAVGANSTYLVVDFVNIGDISSEEGHNIVGWSDPWDWGGGYGGGDDGTFRLLMGPGDGCDTETDRDAYFTMNTNGDLANKLVLRHLDGSQPDDFDVFVQEGEDWAFIGHYDQQTTSENWFNSDYAFSPRCGEIQFKLLATEPVSNWCQNWGQVAFSWAEVRMLDVAVNVDIDPDTLNKKSKGNYVTAYIELGPGCSDFSGIDVSSIELNDVVPSELSPTAIGDDDGDGVPDLMVKFDREQVQAILMASDSVEITITGEVNGIDFEGTDTIRVIDKGKEHTSGDASSVVY